MPEAKIRRRRGLLALFSLMLLAALACNAPMTAPTKPPPPTSIDQTPTADGGAEDAPTATGTATGDAADTATGTATPPGATATATAPLPTFTPIQNGGPTLAPTMTGQPTSTNTPTRSASATPRRTATATRGSSGPLNFTFTISWQLSSVPGEAIATVTIAATGGSGQYTYYRDDLPVAGPVFTYVWATCRGNPGSLRVDSSDGQSVRKDYFEQPPCPTPTPQPG